MRTKHIVKLRDENEHLANGSLKLSKTSKLESNGQDFIALLDHTEGRGINIS